MKSKNLIIYIFIIIFILLVVSVLIAIYLNRNEEINTSQLANPASIYCEEQGGISEIRTNSDGSQIGYCIFQDGSECEEWAFYRGKCKK